MTARRRHRAWIYGGRRSAAARSGCRDPRACPAASCASSTTAPAPSPNSTQVPRSVQSSMRENVSAPITSAREKAPELQKRVGRRQAIDEAGAHRLQIEGGAMGDAELGLHRNRARRESIVRRRGRQHDEVDRLRIDTRVRERGAARRAPPFARSLRRARRCGARECRCAGRSIRPRCRSCGRALHW